MKGMRSLRKILIIFFLVILMASVGGYFLLRHWVIMSPPEVDDLSVTELTVSKKSDSLFFIGANWMHLNDKGWYELYTEGKPFERGVIAGKLSKELVDFQEQAFITRIDELVPSRSYQRFLRFLIAVFNQPLYKSVPAEYLEEIYGVSRSASDAYDFVGPKYDRILHYHGAHDIGHMLQNYNLVGCTSFAVWGEKSSDSSLLIGRNFDFYVGDDFDKNKIIEFCKPTDGYGFMMITWGGMRGVVSGMNEKGLTVTLNAAKSVIPLHVADPVSLIAREILQYASNIDEAVKIAEKRSCFVSESFLIGSAQDHRAVVIEKAPHGMDIYEGNNDQLICTNHFQSKTFQNEVVNLKHIERSASMPRYHRMEELLDAHAEVSVSDAASILRDQKGLGNTDIGMGNEQAVNQLIAHHSIIFKPEQGLVWISCSPYQLGEYICYDLNEVFSKPEVVNQQSQIYKKDLTLPSDSFCQSKEWKDYLEYKDLTPLIKAGRKAGKEYSIEELNAYCALNPNFFYPYEVCGDYCTENQRWNDAKYFYEIALGLVIPTMDEKERVEEKVKNLNFLQK